VTTYAMQCHIQSRVAVPDLLMSRILMGREICGTGRSTDNDLASDPLPPVPPRHCVRMQYWMSP
jgi:hypothetical protein